jgi:hypothetical protein
MSFNELRARFQQPKSINTDIKRRITPHRSHTKSLAELRASLFSSSVTPQSPKKQPQFKHQLRLSVKQLCFVFEQLSSQYGLSSNHAKSTWLAELQKKLAAGLGTSETLKLDEALITDIAIDAGLIERAESNQTKLTVEESESSDDECETTFVQEDEEPNTDLVKPSEPMISTILPSQTPLNHTECDMIVCAVVTKIVNGHRVHEIGLKCSGCESKFVMSAAHECETSSGPEMPGLEWISNGDGNNCINMIL